ncbi:DUF4422 domain-containing protein [Campylobacter jejuni]|uniref:DUF4422 domain-containing protein n=1 Tax=Campylobacter jejuni TaxID=197 RepID=UPI0022423691|nr:DUF4422 domain-containing protein [Campylobacter jejuni]
MEKKNKNPSIKILVGYHKPATLIKNDILTPIHLGRALVTEASKDGEMSKGDFEWMCENMIGDDTGDNISYLNRYLNELTGIYWAWKNYDKLGNPDYIGYEHYRRHFIFKENIILPPIDGLENYFHYFDNINQSYLEIIDLNNFNNIELFDLIVPEPYLLEKNKFKTTTIENDFSIYCESVDILYDLEKIMQNSDAYREISELFFTKNFYYFCNMFIMKKELFFSYCEFLFKIIFALLDKYKDKLSTFSNPNQTRALAFIAEHITTFYILKQEAELKKIKYAKIGFVKNTIDPKLELELLKRTLKKEIEKNSIVSFDLFDTLLLRIFYKPEDIFAYLEEYFQANGFKKNRIDAERLAKKKKGCYPKYDDIYQYIDKKFYYLKKYEEELEYNNIYINPLMKDIFEYAKSLNKKIIFTTDMYYDKTFFVNLLHKNGICGFDEIYISGELGKSKESGELFLYINKQLNIGDNTILHIGDNYTSDYLKPKNYNWNAFHIYSPFNYFSKYDQISSSFLARKGNITSSVILGFMLKKWLYSKNQYEYWKNIGYCYGGPICYALAKFTYSEAIREKLCNFIFVARDGFVIKKIFDLIQSKQPNKKIKTHYIRAPRIINLLINLDLDSSFSWDKAGSIIRSFKKYIINFENININKLTHLEKLDLIKSNWDELKKISKIKYLEYCKYIANFNIKASKIGFFDLSANSFSSMKIFHAVFPKSTKIKGYYWNVLSDAYVNKFDYKAFNSLDTFLDNYAISELLITSNELPIEDIMLDGKFKFLDNKLEKQRVQITDKIIEGEIEFSNDLLSVFGNRFDLIFDNATLIDYINYFTNNTLFNDKYFLENVYQAVNEDHTRYMKLKFAKYDYNFNYSPIGAVNKIKSQLSYKLGYALVNSRNFIDFVRLPVILISIIIAHKHQSKLLNFLSLEQYADYKEACKVKGHLSYLLGAYLLKHPFKFIFNFKRIINDFRKNKK